jgi:hypothetical protein
LRSSFSAASLAGKVTAAPAEFANWFNNVFANPAVLDPTASFANGAQYVKYTATNIGDRYEAFDCHTATTGKNVDPCQTSTTLQALLGSGYRSNSDNVTYALSDGTITTVGNVQIWVANAPRPASASLSSTVKYRIYFQLGTSVYTGDLIKNGATLGGSYWTSNPAGATLDDQLTYFDYQVRMNASTRESLRAAVQL